MYHYCTAKVNLSFASYISTHKFVNDLLDLNLWLQSQEHKGTLWLPCSLFPIRWDARDNTSRNVTSGFALVRKSIRQINWGGGGGGGGGVAGGSNGNNIILKQDTYASFVRSTLDSNGFSSSLDKQTRFYYDYFWWEATSRPNPDNGIILLYMSGPEPFLSTKELTCGTQINSSDCVTD